jgi:hypothetical protein
MYLRIFLFFVSTLLFSISTASGQENKTVSGYVTDADNGETLIGANIYIAELRTGTTSNEYGYYSLYIPEGSYTLLFSYVGFETVELPINLSENQVINMELGFMKTELQEVVVSAEAANSNVSQTEMSVNKMDIATIQKMPTLLGEVEVLRSIQLLPGITSVGEGATGFNVRGGSIDQNLVLLDEAPVYNSSHLFGFFSVFNPDAIKDVKLFKGGIPARYGGRLSSILDVRMKEGNNKQFNLQGGIGAIFSRLSVEAPLVKDRSSFILAARRSYIDVLAKPFLSEDLNDSVLNFYDLTFKTHYDINDKNRIFLSAYTGRDNFGFGDDAGFNWGNATLTFRWNHLFSDRLFSNITLYTSDYDYQISFGDDAVNRFDWDAKIVNYSVKPEFTYFLTPDMMLRFGGQGIIYRFEPGNAIGISEGETTDISLDNKYAIESGLFVENDHTINNNFSINYGLRWSFFDYTGKGIAYSFGNAQLGKRRPVTGEEFYDQWESIKRYNYFEPRILVKYQWNDQTSLKLSYNRMAQYIHLVSNTTAATPVDIWTPSTNNLRPQLSDQIALGFFRNFKDNMYEFSAETYFKRMDRLVDYVDGADILLNEYLEGDLLEGDGRAYGLEFMLMKNKGKFTGWISYTLAKTERSVPGINNGEWYPSRFDQTHNLSISAFYELNKRVTFSGNFALISGTPTTFPTARFEQQGYIIPQNDGNFRNNVRIPTYHRLDLSMTLQGKKNDKRRWNSEWVFSVYNVYSRRNAFSIFFRQQEDIITEAVRLSVVGNFIPAVSYNFNF